MSNASSNASGNAISRLASQSEAVGRLAQDSGGFAAVVAAFEYKDANAFRWVLQRLDMLPYCELICEWVRVKLCTLRCAEICGVPREKIPVPTLQEFARAVVKLSSHEKVLRRVVDAVSCGDGSEYHAALDELKLGEFCQLICYWVCSVGYDQVCEVVCRPQPVPLQDPLRQLRNAGESIAAFLKHDKAFDAISKSAVALNCETLQSAVAQAGVVEGCEYLCSFICVWRSVWVCRELCEVPVPILKGPYAIEEAQNFALAARQLAGQPRVLGDLVNAVQSRNAAEYRNIVNRFGLGPYCWQLCAWVGSITCYEFCICVCPNHALQPWFTTVGDFNIYTQIDPGSGRTNTSLPHTSSMPYGGGPNFAFYNQLQLGGFCPLFSPISPSTPMQYRFLYATGTDALASPISASQTSITVTGGASTPPTPFNLSVCVCSPTGATSETMTVTNVSGTTWTVTRGQGGTTAAAAASGTTLLTGTAPITGPLVDTPVLVGQRVISWPVDNFGIAGLPASTFENVYVGYGTDPLQPTFGSPYVAPAHYLAPDPTTGWVAVDTTLIGGGIQQFLSFDTNQVVAGGCPLTTGLCVGCPGGAPAGAAVPLPNQEAGKDLSIIFQATRVGVSAVDYSNSLCKIHINNWSEVNNLWFLEFGTDCCTGIDTSLSVQFTVDHEEMSAGAWSLEIDNCSGVSAPGNITPTASSVGPPPVTVSPRGGFGTIAENTTNWVDCSYQVWLKTRPGLTTGLYDRPETDNLLTFCICSH